MSIPARPALAGCVLRGWVSESMCGSAAATLGDQRSRGAAIWPKTPTLLFTEPLNRSESNTLRGVCSGPGTSPAWQGSAGNSFTCVRVFRPRLCLAYALARLGGAVSGRNVRVTYV